MTELLNSVAEGLLVLAALLTVIRFVRGPTVFDRIVCVEVLLVILVGFLVIEGREQGARAYIDAALGLALFSFIGTAFLAFYLGKGELHE
ncbi:MAG: monovalent cation/H+ antiporter complex subunit F [Polyangiaceae bacterium]|jgi:multisubunit Na+/H+ antiporter MnhF subunit|nr:monovalent cation/H+ antiporter complex subunit F [Polyangiaceae bacterium]